jgi:nucleotide-binding universal stress UspA family protein
MNEPIPSGSVLVAVDGSEASLAALRWAVDEAVSRTTTLALVHTSPFVGSDYPASPEEGHARAILSVAGPRPRRRRAPCA